ncbi:LysM peptidoglycan-binding domain-containing protein [Lentilactobacillus rapi]|uniref:LysM peptidoglycan-binding domain-containing protein n=1 Tax=Lentilactobacillus rapi TaxID=481723 RepID=UPI0006CFA7EB|nr:LysM peptidoglycan-binding domain-containing protein [Lentilactobacillus rapi]
MQKKSSSAHSDVKKENAKQSSVNKAKTAERSKREQRRASAAESSPTTKAKASTSSSITAASSESTAQKPAGTSAAKRTTATQKSVSGSRYATVEPGQGLYRVAVNHGISLAELMRLNGLSTTSSIHPGQQLRVR